MSKSINNSKGRGFTIVELLVVIVVIGILAAITIVSYSGITNRANSSSAQSSANSVIQKAGAYSADSTSQTWPTTLAALTGASSDKSYALTGVTYDALASQPSAPNKVQFQLCGTTGSATVPANYAAITVPSGIQVGYWKYDGTPGVQYYTAGTTSGNYLTYPVACFASGS